MKNNCFSIDDLRPFFHRKFQMEIPDNLRPRLLSVESLELTQQELNDYHDAQKFLHNRWFQRLKNMGKETAPLNLSPEDQRKDKTYQRIRAILNDKNKPLKDLYLRRDLTEEQIIEIKKKNRITASPVTYWLANRAGKGHQIRGLTADGLRQIPEGVYQIGQEDSNTKGYFIYTATSADRRVRIRFPIWSQYNMELHRDEKRQERVCKFFRDFEDFEVSTKGEISSLFLLYDMYIGTSIDIVLKNGERITCRNIMGNISLDYQLFERLFEELIDRIG